MKATELLKEIRENLKDYPIEYLKNKVTDDRYKDSLTKQLAKYNSETWDEIFAIDITTIASCWRQSHKRPGLFRKRRIQMQNKNHEHQG